MENGWHGLTRLHKFFVQTLVNVKTWCTFAKILCHSYSNLISIVTIYILNQTKYNLPADFVVVFQNNWDSNPHSN